MTEKANHSYNVKKDALRVLLLVASPLAVAAFILERTGVIRIYDSGDFTNAFGFFIEIGVAVFIALLLFRYSSAQQTRASGILEQVSDTTRRLGEISDTLETQKRERKEVILSAISNTLTSIWSTAQNTLFLIYMNGFRETNFDKDLSDFVRRSVADDRRSIALNLEQLQFLALLGSGELDSKMISGLNNLYNDLQWRIRPETTLGRAGHPWSGTLYAIDRFAKDHFKNMSQRLILFPDIEQCVEKGILEAMKKK